MNGMAVQDLTYKDDGIHSGSIRQFNSDSSRWYVHYFTTGSPIATLPSWVGDRKGDKIVLNRDQAAPIGMDGYMRVDFLPYLEDLLHK